MSPTPPTGVLVIGVGNPMRGDDAVGWRVVEALVHTPGLRALSCGGDVSELVEAWQGEERVVVVDACDAGRAPGTIVTLDAVRDPLPARSFPSSHAWGLAQAIELSRALGTLPRELRVVAVELADVAHGAGLSPGVAAAVPAACEAVRALARGHEPTVAPGATRGPMSKEVTVHEMSLIADILRRIEQIAQAQDAQRVTRVEVLIGAWAHISPEHFREHFEAGVRGTIAEDAILDARLGTDTNDPRAQDIVLVSVEVE